MYFKKYLVVYSEILKQVQNDIDYLKQYLLIKLELNYQAELISATHHIITLIYLEINNSLSQTEQPSSKHY